MTAPLNAAPPMDETALRRLLGHVAATHPEQTDIIVAFTPLLLTRNRLLCELPSLPAQQNTTFAAQLSKIDAETAYNVALAVLDAMSEGFPGTWQSAVTIREALDPRITGLLCEAWFARDFKAAALWAEQHNAATDVLTFMQGQTCRILAAHVAASMPETKADNADCRCPCCGCAPELSVIHGPDGQRSLVCCQCGRVWRFRRTACPACGREAPENLHSLYVEDHPEERGVWCATCGRYLLEVDIRHLDLAPGQCQALALALGHLDALMQQEGKRPLQSSGENSCETSC